MIERLVQSLRTLAGSAPADLPAQPDELALDFADALLLVSDCPQVHLTPAQQRALEGLDELLQGMTGPHNASLWTAASLRHSPRWAEVREQAARALTALGEPAQSRRR